MGIVCNQTPNHVKLPRLHTWRNRLEAQTGPGETSQGRRSVSGVRDQPSVGCRPQWVSLHLHRGLQRFVQPGCFAPPALTTSRGPPRPLSSPLSPEMVSGRRWQPQRWLRPPGQDRQAAAGAAQKSPPSFTTAPPFP